VSEIRHYWQTVFHLNGGDRQTTVEHCKTLGICRQTVVQRKGYQILEEFCFFEGENKPDDPVYSLHEILREVRYREAVRLGDEGLKDVEAISQGGV